MATKSINLAKEPTCIKVGLPGSKSLTNRALIIAAMASGKTVLKNVLFSDDIDACLEALLMLGVKINVNRGERIVTLVGASGHGFVSDVTLNARDAGTVSRFLLPACSAMEGKYKFIASQRMCQRPMDALLDVLVRQGVDIVYENQVGHLPLFVSSSGLSGGRYVIPGVKSSQFLSGLLIASPYAKSPTMLISNVEHQQPYVMMTINVMRSFGVNVECVGNAYHIDNHQVYKGCNYTIEPDISTATYFWALAALTGGQVTVKNISFDSLQGDIQFLGLLAEMNCSVSETDEGICVTGSGVLKGVNANLRTFSDTFMTVAVLACFADSKTHLTGLSHTRLQESDRVECMAKGLRVLGAKIETSDDSITIFPSRMNAGVVDGCNDHRIAMSLALVGVKVDGVKVKGAECVKKTCPDYFERMQNIIK